MGLAGNAFQLAHLTHQILNIFILTVMAGSAEIVIFLPIMVLYSYHKQCL